AASYYDRGRPAAVGLPKDAFRPSPSFLTVLAFFAMAGALLWTQLGNVRFNVFLFIVAGWVVSLCLHEYAHALFAFRFGDHGVAIRGYLRLDPLKYANPLFSIVIPVIFMLLGGIALPGGAVLVDNAALRTRRRRRRDHVPPHSGGLLRRPWRLLVGARPSSVLPADGGNP